MLDCHPVYYTCMYRSGGYWSFEILTKSLMFCYREAASAGGGNVFLRPVEPGDEVTTIAPDGAPGNYQPRVTVRRSPR